MGANMCNDADTHSLLIDPSDMANMYDFQRGSWPNDQYLMKLLKNSSVASGQIKNNPYCHRFFQRYYWGGMINNRPFGKGIYFINTSPNKYLYYEGDIDGEPNGRGMLDYNKGQWIYHGQVNNGQAHGRGKMLNNKQQYQFEGDWLNSRPIKGNLILHRKQNVSQKENEITGLPQTPTFKNNGDIFIDFNEESHENVIKYPDGCVYNGQIDKKRFVPDGVGKLVVPGKNQYIGQWHQGQMHGVGKYQWADGSFYTGDYMFGKRQGNGKFVFNNGRYYIGQWSNGKQNGHGTLYSKQGQILKKGLWKRGNFNNQ